MELAENYGVEIQNYREAELVKVIGDGIERDVDDDGNAIKDYCDSYAEYECISASGYECLTGRPVEVEKGNYLRLAQKNVQEGFWYHFDDVSKFYIQSEQSYLPLSYAGNEEYNALTVDDGMGSSSRFIVNDEDYEKLRKNLPKEKMVTQVLFDTTDGDGEIPFATALWKEFGGRISGTMDVMGYYDPCKVERSKDRFDFKGAIFDPDSPLKETDWKYTPMMIPLKSQQCIMIFAVRFIIFFYIFVICMAAVGIISFTRSQSVGISNALVFNDLEKLGADQAYLRKLLKKQIQKVFVLPTGLGICLITGFQILIMCMNDGVLQSYEIQVVIAAVVLSVLTVLYQLGIYRFSLEKVRKMLGL